MNKAALIGAVAFATVGICGFTSGLAPALAQDLMQGDVAETGSVGGPVVTEAKIARLKRALRLSPSQEQHWHAVEAALRRLVHAPRREADGLVQRVRAKVNGYAGSAAAMQSVASSAGPLIATLDDKQKQDGMRLIREFGFSAQ
jgi:hypothetical protein